MSKQENPSNNEALHQIINAKWDSLQAEIATMKNEQAETVAESEPEYLQLTKHDESIIRRKIEEFEEKECRGEVRWYSMEESYKMIMEALHSGKPIQY